MSSMEWILSAIFAKSTAHDFKIKSCGHPRWNMGFRKAVKNICATKKWESHISFENGRNAERCQALAARFPNRVAQSNGIDDFLKFQLDNELQLSEIQLLKEQLRVVDDAGERCCSFCYTNESALPHGLKMCNGCYVAMYCSPQCQRRDWRRGTHKHLCRRIQRLNEAQSEHCPPLLDLSSSDSEWEFFQKNNQKKN